jgi:hypothetical protein
MAPCSGAIGENKSVDSITDPDPAAGLKGDIDERMRHDQRHSGYSASTNSRTPGIVGRYRMTAGVAMNTVEAVCGHPFGSE